MQVAATMSSASTFAQRVRWATDCEHRLQRRVVAKARLPGPDKQLDVRRPCHPRRLAPIHAGHLQCGEVRGLTTEKAAAQSFQLLELWSMDRLVVDYGSLAVRQLARATM